MRTGKEALRIIKNWEGFRAAPYKCSAGVWTIGYGTTVYPGGQKVTERDPEISQAQAEGYLEDHIKTKIEPQLNKLINVMINQNQWDALVSFCYNVGLGNFKTSTMLKLIKKGLFAEAAKEFSKWNKAGGKELAGLIARRKEERLLFEKDPWND